MLKGRGNILLVFLVDKINEGHKIAQNLLDGP